MRPLPFSLFAGLFLVFFAVRDGTAASSPVGERVYQWHDGSRNRTVRALLWYPAAPGSKTAPIVEGGAFTPRQVAVDSAAAPGKRPLLLFSHGSGGMGPRLFWLAEGLVERGYVVLAVDHPGNKTGDDSAEGLMRVWERPKDLRFALDKLLAAGESAELVDKERVAAVGHSAGGATVLMLAGGRFSRARYTTPVPRCAGGKDPYFEGVCQALKKIDPKRYSRTDVEGDYRDPRVKAVIALDPGFARSFDPPTLRALPAKTLVMAAEKLDEPQGEIYAKDFSTLLPAGDYEVLPGSVHMTFLQTCKDDEIAKLPEVAMLCGRRADKLALQAKAADRAAAFLHTALGR